MKNAIDTLKLIAVVIVLWTLTAIGWLIDEVLMKK